MIKRFILIGVLLGILLGNPLGIQASDIHKELAIPSVPNTFTLMHPEKLTLRELQRFTSELGGYWYWFNFYKKENDTKSKVFYNMYLSWRTNPFNNIFFVKDNVHLLQIPIVAGGRTPLEMIMHLDSITIIEYLRIVRAE